MNKMLASVSDQLADLKKDSVKHDKEFESLITSIATNNPSQPVIDALRSAIDRKRIEATNIVNLEAWISELNYSRAMVKAQRQLRLIEDRKEELKKLQTALPIFRYAADQLQSIVAALGTNQHQTVISELRDPSAAIGLETNKVDLGGIKLGTNSPIALKVALFKPNGPAPIRLVIATENPYDQGGARLSIRVGEQAITFDVAQNTDNFQQTIAPTNFQSAVDSNLRTLFAMLTEKH